MTRGMWIMVCMAVAVCGAMVYTAVSSYPAQEVARKEKWERPSSVLKVDDLGNGCTITRIDIPYSWLYLIRCGDHITAVKP